jgi:hypothetical protein
MLRELYRIRARLVSETRQADHELLRVSGHDQV